MKRFVVAASFVALSTVAQAQSEAPVSEVPETNAAVSPAPMTMPMPVAPTETTQTGKIIIYRGSGVVGLALGCPVRYKGKEIVELGRGKYAEWDVPPGSYILTNKTASVEVNVTGGQTKYVRCQIKTGFMTGRADLQIVDEESFAEHQADFERKQIVAPASFPKP